MAKDVMHIYFSGIGGAAIGPLALIAQQAGYVVSGSDKQDSQYIQYLRKHGIANIHIGQTRDAIAAVHAKQPIDWLVYSSAISKEHSDHPELAYAAEQHISATKRDELINQILQEKNLRMIAIAGTHGKSTTTSMVIWLYHQLGIPISYSVGAKISFGDMGHYDANSTYFVYEADEFDRNFLAFHPHLSLIVGVAWDHHEIFPTLDSYYEAFATFIGQSDQTILWQEDVERLHLQASDSLDIQQDDNPNIASITLAGHYNRLDAWLAVCAVHTITDTPLDVLINHINAFPGAQRRMEPIVPGLYTDYAHTPEKIRGGLSVALEMASKHDQKVVIVYEPLTNRRQHYMKEAYKDCFAGAAHVYWVPSYLAREDSDQPILSPAELITYLDDPSIATPMEPNDTLQQTIQKHLDAGDMVVAMTGGGGNSLDEWLRLRFPA